jgi:hypothetical protein
MIFVTLDPSFNSLFPLDAFICIYSCHNNNHHHPRRRRRRHRQQNSVELRPSAFVALCLITETNVSSNCVLSESVDT